MKKRILYVDDSPLNRSFFRRLLTAEGYELLEAGDGESGWQMALTESPDLIFTDLLMPGFDGFELTRQIKATPKLSHIPVVTLTAYGNKEIERIAKEAGSDGFLHKPTSAQKIRMILHQFLGDDIVSTQQKTK